MGWHFAHPTRDSVPRSPFPVPQPTTNNNQQPTTHRLGILLGHLLLWQYQPELSGNSWLATIREQRREILTLLEENPSLKPYLQEALALAYQSGLDLAVRETGLSYTKFPESCPYTWEQSLDAEFFPN